MSTETGPAPRTAALKAARQRDSQDKRQRALASIEALEAAGTPVTVTSVARAAAVSTWLVYAPGVREHLEAARRRQAGRDLGSSPRPSAPRHSPAPASLRTDLALARDEIGPLRAERDKLRKRLRLQLGAEIDGPDRAQLIARVAELEAANRQLVAERDARSGEAEVARLRVGELEDELAAARESLRRAIRAGNLAVR